MISRTRATVSSVWAVEGLPGRGGRLQRIGVHYWNGNTTQMSSIDFGRNLRKLHAAFRMFQHQFSPDRNRNQCTHAAALSPPSWNATHTVVDVHPRVSTERMRGDTDLLFCTFTCTELPRVALCCLFIMYYNFPEKKSVPELNISPCTPISNIYSLVRAFIIMDAHMFSQTATVYSGIITLVTVMRFYSWMYA